jgi:hypothetical protein
MKISVTTILLLFSLATTRPAEAHWRGLHQLPLLLCRPGARPLTRYLTATLHLTHKQAVAVQRALRSHTATRLTPEQLTLSLSPVLSPEAQEQLLDIQANAASYQTLAYLTTRH